MKKLLLINMLLVFLLYILPQKEIVIEKEIIPKEIKTISSRSQTDVRQVIEQVNEQVDEQVYIAPTTYTEELVEMVKRYEGFKSTAYKLNGETYWTIGYGHHGKDVKEGQVITEEEADRLLRAELDGAKDYVLKHCDYLELTQGQLDALTSFTYNGGLGMLQKLTANKTRTADEIAEHITAYTNGGLKGLVTRRNEELKMFKGDD